MKVQRSDILIPLLEDSYRDEYTEWSRHNLRFSDAGAAANFGEKCEREIVYDLMDTDLKNAGKEQLKTPLSSGALAFFDDGRIHEQDIRRRLRLVLRSPEQEVIHRRTGAKGRIDNTAYFNSVKRYLPPGMIVPTDKEGRAEDPLLEIKTSNQFQFDHMVRTERPSFVYYDQVQLYLYQTKKPWAILLIKNRNSFGPDRGRPPYLEFVVWSDAARQKEILTGLLVTKKAATESRKLGENIVPRPFQRTSSKCQFCRFKLHCWGKDEPEIQKHEPDATVDAPSQELVESATLALVENQAKAKELDAVISEAKEVLERYFKATGEKELSVQGHKVHGIRQRRKYIDDSVVREKVGRPEYLKVSTATKAGLEKAIERREIDAGVLEDATKTKPASEVQVRVYPLKDEGGRVSTPEAQTKSKEEKKDANQGTKRGQKATKTRSTKARGKGSKSGGKGVSEGN